tara:strand:- start:568 stop:972 length:405 start_codon:yes stop_codon:yes gene_type:complete
MRPLALAIEEHWVDPVLREHGRGWKAVAKILGVTPPTLLKWRRHGFPGRVLPALVRESGVRGEPLLKELARVLGMPPFAVLAMVSDCRDEPTAGGWCRQMAGRALGVGPVDALLLFDACRERPEGVGVAQEAML